VTLGRPDSILGQFGETARCHDAQHGDGVCCAFAPQLVFILVAGELQKLQTKDVAAKAEG